MKKTRGIHSQRLKRRSLHRRTNKNPGRESRVPGRVVYFFLAYTRIFSHTHTHCRPHDVGHEQAYNIETKEGCRPDARNREQTRLEKLASNATRGRPPTRHPWFCGAAYHFLTPFNLGRVSSAEDGQLLFFFSSSGRLWQDVRTAHDTSRKDPVVMRAHRRRVSYPCRT